MTLDYVVQDGASTDRTVETARRALGGRGVVRSEPDAGMYDALRKAWRGQSEPADIYFYLNAGDLLQPGALALVAEVMQRERCQWLAGLHTHYSARGPIVGTRIPFRYKRQWILSGMYGRALPHIQQESQFWSGSLMSAVDLDQLSRFRLAGDYFMWTCFARQVSPTIIEASLSGFKLHGGHLSSDHGDYWAEVAPYLSHARPSHLLAVQIEKLLWRAPWSLKRRLAPTTLWYERVAQRWSAR